MNELSFSHMPAGTYKFRVKAICNGKEALPEIIKQKPSLVISDIMMPEMDGNTLCTKTVSYTHLVGGCNGSVVQFHE